MPQVINNLDLKKNEIQNVVLQPLSTPPSDPKLGQKYFNTNDKNEYRWNGTAWVTYQAPLSTTTASTISIPNGIVKGDGSTLTAATAGTDYQAPLPSQAGNSGKYLTTNGSVLSWASPPGAPVTSVNTKTGDVVLSASDVGAQPSITASGILKGNGSGTITAATAGTDYQAPITFDGTYNASTNKAATVSTVTNAINALDGGTIGTGGASKTITSLSQTNGNVSATFGDISITKSQVSDFPTSMTPTSHASSSNTYGVGTDSNYGHLKLSDSTTSTSSTSGGVAATPAAVKAVKDAIPNVPSWALESTKPTYTASEVGAVATTAVGAASGVVPLNASSKIDSTYLPSYVDDVIEGYYNSTDGKFYEESTYTTEITGEAGKIYVDLTSNLTYRWSGTEFVEISSGGSVVSFSRDLTSGTKIGTITINGTGMDLYAPTDTDTKVTHTKVTPSSYTYWRTFPFGQLSASTATTAFATTATTGIEYSVDNIRFQPSEGILRIIKMASGETAATGKAGTVDTVRGTFKGHNYTVTATNSDTTNYMSSDSSNNIWFMVNNGADCVLCLYSNGTTKTVRSGGSAAGTVDLGTSSNNWKDIYLCGTIYNSPSSTTVASGDKILVNDTSAGTISSGITLGSSTTQYLANDGSWQNIPTVPTNCEVTVTHIVGTWNVDTTYATMVAAHNAGGIVYFTYGSYTAIASFHTSNTVTANIMYMDSEGIHQIQIAVNSSDEVNCTETDCPIYNGEVVGDAIVGQSAVT